MSIFHNCRRDACNPMFVAVCQQNHSSVLKIIQESIDNGYGTVKLKNITLGELPPCIQDLSNLVYLDEQGNLSKELKLEANFTSLIKFPSNVLNLTNLTSLNLNNNPIMEIPSEISKLVNLERLSIVNCELKLLPVTLFELPKLTNVNTSANPFIYPSDHSFDKPMHLPLTHALPLKELCLRSLKFDDKARGIKGKTFYLPARLENDLEGLKYRKCTNCRQHLLESNVISIVWLPLTYANQAVPFKFTFCSLQCRSEDNFELVLRKIKGTKASR